MKNILIISLLILCFHQPSLAGDGAGTMPGKVQASYQLVQIDDLGFLATESSEVIESFVADLNLPEFAYQIVGEFRLIYFPTDMGVYVFDFTHKALFELSHQEFDSIYGSVEDIYYADPINIEPADLFYQQLEYSGRIPFRLDDSNFDFFGQQ